MSRLPIRIRVTAAFALAMAAVLGLTALFLYLRLGSHLTTALDRELRVRAQDLAALAGDPRAPFPDGRFVEHGESYAQLSPHCEGRPTSTGDRYRASRSRRGCSRRASAETSSSSARPGKTESRRSPPFATSS